MNLAVEAIDLSYQVLPYLICLFRVKKFRVRNFLSFSLTILLQARILWDVSDCTHHLRYHCLVTSFFLLVKELKEVHLNIVDCLNARCFIIKLGELRHFISVIYLPVDVNTFLKHQPKISLVKIENEVLSTHFGDLAQVLLSPVKARFCVLLFQIFNHVIECLKLVLE